MLKITIKGEVYSFDQRYPLSEAIEIEEQLGMTFGRWQDDLAQGSAKATAGFAWLVLRRNGRDVPLADILSGTYELDRGDVIAEEEGDGAPVNPPSSPTTGGDGSASSRKSSGSPRPRPAP